MGCYQTTFPERALELKMRIPNHSFKGLKIDVVTSYMNAFQEGSKHKIGFCKLSYMKAFKKASTPPLIIAFLAFPLAGSH